MTFDGSTLTVTGAQTISGLLTANGNIFMNRQGAASRGFLWYSTGYTAWQDYMAPAGASQGASGTITSPAGTLVTTWARRSFIENASSYGWIFESGTSNSTTPTVQFEIRASDGAWKSAGGATIGGDILPSTNDAYSLGSAGSGFESLRIEHTTNRALGVALVQTGASLPSPRLFFNNPTSFAGAGIAVLHSASNSLQFNTNSTVDVSSGTSRWYFNANGIYPNTTNAYALGSSALRWNGVYATIVDGSSYVNAPLWISAGTASSRDKIRVWSSTPYSIGMGSSYTYGGLVNDYAMTFQMNSADTRGFWWGDSSHTNAQGAMALTTDGKLTVAHSIRLGYGEADTTVPGATYRLDVSGNTYIAGTHYVTGDVYAYYSDERLKTRINTIDNALDKVLSLDGFIYVENEVARSLGYSNTKQQIGVSAQQVQAVLPEAVHLAPFDITIDADTKQVASLSGENYLSVQYDKLVPLLIEAIKEQQKQIDELKRLLEDK